MTTIRAETGPTIGAGALRTPRSAALAGIVFSVLFGIALVVTRLAIPAKPSDAGSWLSDPTRRDTVLFALALVPFAGIAFLWFIGVVRDRVGALEDRFFGTIFLGSGLLFVATLLAAEAVAVGLVTSAGGHSPSLYASGAWTAGRDVTLELVDVGLQIAGVFTIATSTILLRTGSGPRWVAAVGYAIAAFLLVAVYFFVWTALLFPIWVLAISVDILVTAHRAQPSERSAAESR